MLEHQFTGGGTLSVLLGRGDGTFTNGFVFPTGDGGPVDVRTSFFLYICAGMDRVAGSALQAAHG